MNFYDVWISGDKKFHIITKMETEHIINCIKQLNNMEALNKNRNFEDLTQTELESIHETGQPAWVVLNAKGFLSSFNNEVSKREKEKNT